MDKKKLNISSIETFFNELLENKVSENVFFTTVPTEIDSSWDEFVVVDCSTAIEDLNAYGSGVVLVWLYAKPLGRGQKNVPVMSELEQKLSEAISNNNSSDYYVNRRAEYADYDTDARMHCNIVEIQLLIV